MRTAIIPCTLAELPRLADSAGPGAQFFVKEISRLDQWRKGVPHLPLNRVWCGYNSFNIPATGADHALLSLQGAGDLMILSQFLHDIGYMDYVSCYSTYADMLGDDVAVVPITRLGPTDARVGPLRHEYAYVSNHPMALQFLRNDALAEGWDMYDWFGLMLGIAPDERWVHIRWRDDPYPGLVYGPRPIIALHVAASTPPRSIPDLIPFLHRQFGSDIRLMLLGGSESASLPALPYNFAGQTTYHGTYRLLQNPLVSAVIAVESVVLHLAAVARPDLPVLGIYNHTPVSWAGPRRHNMDVFRIDKTQYKEVYSWLNRHLSGRSSQ